MRRSCFGASPQRYVCVGATGLLIGGLLVFATLSANDQIPTHQDDSVPPSSGGATLDALQQEAESFSRSSEANVDRQKREKLKQELASLQDLEDSIKSQARRKTSAQKLNKAQMRTLTRLSRKRAAHKLKKARTKAKPHKGKENKSLVDHIVFSKTLTSPKDPEARLALAEAILNGPEKEIFLNEDPDEKTVEPHQDEAAGDQGSKRAVKKTRNKAERNQVDSKTNRRKKNVPPKGTFFKPSKEDVSALETEWRQEPTAARRVAKHLARAESALRGGGTQEMSLDEIGVAPPHKQAAAAVAAHLARAERTLHGDNPKEMSLDEIGVASPQPQASLKQGVAVHLARADATIERIEESEDALALKRQLEESQAFSQEIMSEEQEEATVPLW